MIHTFVNINADSINYKV